MCIHLNAFHVHLLVSPVSTLDFSTASQTNSKIHPGIIRSRSFIHKVSAKIAYSNKYILNYFLCKERMKIQNWFIPMHFLPFSWNPGSQPHWKLPIVLKQRWWQELGSWHSLISVGQNRLSISQLWITLSSFRWTVFWFRQHFGLCFELYSLHYWHTFGSVYFYQFFIEENAHGTQTQDFNSFLKMEKAKGLKKILLG